MIEKVADFFKDVKERLSNPLLSAYLIAWCLYNWKVVIGILFFKSTELKIEGYDSYFDMIRCEVTWRSGFWLPLLSAAGYVLVFPFIRNGVFIVGAWFRTWGNEKVMKVSKTGQVSVLRYIALRDKYLKSIDNISEIAKSESEYLIKNKELSLEIDTIKIDYETNSQHLAEWNKLSNASYLDGTWDLSIHRHEPTSNGLTQLIMIKGNIEIKNGLFSFNNKDQRFRYDFNNKITAIATNGVSIFLEIESTGTTKKNLKNGWRLNSKTNLITDGRPIYFEGEDYSSNKISLTRS